MDISKQFKEALEPQVFEVERGGPVMKLKRVGLMDLILTGRIPDNLSAQAAKVASQTVAKQMTVDELKQYGELVDAVFTAAVVEPKIGEEIQASEIPFAWKVKVFNWANASTGVLRPFRPEPSRTVEAA